VRSNKGSGLKVYLKLDLKLFLKLFFPKVRNLSRKGRVDVAIYAVRRVTWLPLALMVSHPTPLLLMMFILLGRMRVAMCLPNMLALKVVSRKEPFGLPSLL
jgi:hypothetical protein